MTGLLGGIGGGFPLAAAATMGAVVILAAVVDKIADFFNGGCGGF